MSELVHGSHVVIHKAIHDTRTGRIENFDVQGIASHVTATTFVVTYGSGAMELIHRSDRHWRLVP